MGAGLPGGFPHSHTHSVTLLALAPAWLLLARPFLHPWPTWVGCVVALVGLLHLTIVTGNVRPVSAAVWPVDMGVHPSARL